MALTIKVSSMNGVETNSGVISAQQYSSVNLLHPENTYSPIVLRFLGRVTESKFSQPANALSLIVFMLFGNAIKSKPIHPEKAEVSIDVTP